jgi:hypothetical protein
MNTLLPSEVNVGELPNAAGSAAAPAAEHPPQVWHHNLVQMRGADWGVLSSSDGQTWLSPER